MNKKLFTLALILALTACGSDKDKKPVVGDSFFENSVNKVSKEQAQTLVDTFVTKLPVETSNAYWPRNGYVPGDNLKFNKGTNYDSASVGSEPESGLDITSGPVISGDRVFTLDGTGTVQARSATDISKLIWESKVSDTYVKNKNGTIEKVTSIFGGGGGDKFIGGNLCFSQETLYVSTKRGYLFAIAASDGKILWSKDFGSPIRSIPIARENTVAFVTADNRTIAVNGTDGSKLWQHQGLASTSRVSSSPAPLLIGDKLIVPYSSGEIYALNFTNGFEIWNSTLSTSEYGKLSSSFLSDISQSPIYHNNRIYIVSSDGTLNALDVDGNIIWAFEGKAIDQTPWAVGDFLFTTTRYGELLAISASEGKLVWKNQLADEEKRDEDNLHFTAPIVAAGNIYIADNDGTLYTYSVKDGATLDKISIPENVYLSPVIVGGNMYFLTRDAKLVVLK